MMKGGEEEEEEEEKEEEKRKNISKYVLLKKNDKRVCFSFFYLTNIHILSTIKTYCPRT